MRALVEEVIDGIVAEQTGPAAVGPEDCGHVCGEQHDGVAGRIVVAHTFMNRDVDEGVLCGRHGEAPTSRAQIGFLR